MPTFETKDKVLFGSKSHPWSPQDWTATDDRVRGGSSVSHLTCTTPASATFHGHLDIRTLGGAGFASQRTADALRWDLSGFDALVLHLGSADGAWEKKRYTVVLKDAESLPKRPDGREQSTVSWEFDFNVHANGEAEDGGKEVAMPFADFKATYRGKPKDDAEPLDLARITRVSFMMRSFFGEQEGDFSLPLRSLTAVKKDTNQVGRIESTTADEKQSFDKPGLQQQQQKGQQTSWLGWLAGCFR